MADRHHVRIAGDCVLSNINGSFLSLVAAFEQDGPISVDLSQVGAVDVSFLQLIVSASRTAAQHKKPFGLIGMSDAVDTAFRRASIDTGPMCRPNPQI